MGKSILQMRLEAYANWSVTSKGYQFDDDLNFEISGMINSVIERIRPDYFTNQKLSETSEIEVQQAEAALALLVSKMIMATHTAPGYSELEPSKIGMMHYKWARDHLCPLWPIC